MMVPFDEIAFEKAVQGVNIDNELVKNIVISYVSYYNEQFIDELSEYPDELSKL